MKIALANAGRIYTWDWALRNVTASIEAGRIACVLGANGAGKSTLLHLLSGQLRPTEGTVTIDDRRIRLGAIGPRRRLMYIGPDQPLIGMKIHSHLGTAISAYGKDEPGIENTAHHWLHKFGLLHRSGKRDDLGMSRGEKMKLWLATLFTVRPDVWLLDEPHQCGLDALGLEILEDQMREHRESGGIVVFTSQWPPHARRLADQVLLIDGARLAFDGTSDTLKESLDSRDPSLAAIVRSLESDAIGEPA